MNNNCAQIFGLILLVNTNLAIIISFATPYWIEYNIVARNRGLWAECFQDSCMWVFEQDFSLQSTYPAWFKATQGLMSVGLAFGMLALVLATLSLCCTCNCNQNATICAFLVLSCVSMAVAIIVFGVKANEEQGIGIKKQHFLSIGIFGWSFWVGIGASVLALLTSTIYCCVRSQTY